MFWSAVRYRVLLAHFVCSWVLYNGFLAPTIWAKQANDSAPIAAVSPAPEIPLTYDGPPPPVPPEVISRDPISRLVTIRAVRLPEPLHLDGRLDESIYRTEPGISGFVQMEPNAGSPATERTELWIFFDDTNVYVAFRCWETHPERMIVGATRRRRVSGTTLTKSLHSEGGRTATAAGCRGTGRQNRSTGRGNHSQ